MSEVIIALDLGTSSCRAIVFGKGGLTQETAVFRRRFSHGSHLSLAVCDGDQVYELVGSKNL